MRPYHCLHCDFVLSDANRNQFPGGMITHIQIHHRYLFKNLKASLRITDAKIIAAERINSMGFGHAPHRHHVSQFISD